MYTREIQAPRGSPIENGTPLAGTWGRAFDEVDLLEVRRPFAWPLPGWVRDSRIKEWELFAVQDGRFFLEVLLGNAKLFQMAQIFLHDRESGEKFVFRRLVPGGGWRLPKSLSNASVSSRSSRFFFRVHTWLNADVITLDLDIAAERRHPAFTARLVFNMARRHVTPMAVSLSFAERRNMYAFKALAPVSGDMVLGGQHVIFDRSRSSGIFCDYKGFFPYRMEGVSSGGMGFDGEGRRYGFHLAENQTRETRKNNENALWLDGRLTPLPPVRITMPEGAESDWIIQDVEGMVDLVFSPSQQNRCGASLLLASGDLDTHLGQFNGMLADSGGGQIQVRGLWGMGERLYLRV